MQSVNPLIAGITQKNDLRQERQTTAFEELEVVDFPCARRHA